MKKHMSGLLTAALVACTGIAMSRADQPAPEKKTGEPKPIAPAAAAQPPLTDESLLTMLKNMGYTPEVEKTLNGRNCYKLSIDRAGLTYAINISLSGDKTRLWINAWLSDVPEKEPISADRLLDLLEGNWTYGPAHFRYYSKFRMLNLGLGVDNHDITPSVLREQLETFSNTLTKSEPLWNVKKWKPTDKAIADKPSDKTNGK
jgi:hypothetical protein